MIAVVFGIQGVGKSTVVQGVLAKLGSGWEHRQWGELTLQQAISTNIISHESSLALPDKEVYTDEERGVKIVRSDQGNDRILIREEVEQNVGKDEIRFLDLKTQKSLQKAVGDSLAKEISSNPEKNYLIETHAALKTPYGYLPGFSAEFLNAVKPDIYIIIEAQADQIFVRRLKDKSRKREHDKATQDVQINLDVTRYFAGSFAALTHSPLCIVQNKEKLQEDAVEEIVQVLTGQV